MCDSGSHGSSSAAPPARPRLEYSRCVRVIGCLCGCRRVRDTWSLGEALLRQVEHPDWPVLTGRYVSFSGRAGGGLHCSHALMTHVTVSLYICQPGQELSLYYYCPQKHHLHWMAAVHSIALMIFFLLPIKFYDDALKGYYSHSQVFIFNARLQ